MRSSGCRWPPESIRRSRTTCGRAGCSSTTTSPSKPHVQAIVTDRGYSGLDKLAARKHLTLDIKRPSKPVPPSLPPGQKQKKPKRVFKPLAPLYKVENAFARLGTWRRLSRCYEGSPESARAWLEVACVGHLFGRLRVEPT